eukprot:TRINITY_DN3155_c0_g1_i13.p1 TRINITY_DN3155_c0_g1~~TRINITY_DN3155_c0_g1_i13.p1  ORF type:complete len:420 (-),score=101.77 TRINITY_DN3155_c0_g1_i13:104-1264(-)
MYACKLCGCLTKSYTLPTNTKIRQTPKLLRTTRKTIQCFARRTRKKEFSEQDNDKPQYNYDKELKEFIPDDIKRKKKRDVDRLSKAKREKTYEDFGELLDFQAGADEEEEDELVELDLSSLLGEEVEEEEIEAEIEEETQQAQQGPIRRYVGLKKLQAEEEEEEEEEEYDDLYEEYQREELERQVMRVGMQQYHQWTQMCADQEKMMDEALTMHHDQLENANSRFLLTMEYARIMEELDLEEAAEEEAGDVPLDVTKRKFPLWVEANYKLEENYDQWNEESKQQLEIMQSRLRKREMDEVARELVGIDVSGVLQNVDFANIEYQPRERKERISTMDILFEPVNELIEQPDEGDSEQQQLLYDLLPESSSKEETVEVVQEDFSGEES